jgi:hypothetical protein
VLEPEEHGIERPLIHRQQVTADLLDAAGNPVAVQRAQDLERLEHHQRQRSLLHIPLGHARLLLYTKMSLHRQRLKPILGERPPGTTRSAPCSRGQPAPPGTTRHREPQAETRAADT